MKIEIDDSANLKSSFRDRELLKQVHPQRIGNGTDTSKPSKNLKPWDSNAATCLRNHQSNISDTDMTPETTPKDVLLKKQAFYTDFVLPLSPRNGYTLENRNLLSDVNATYLAADYKKEDGISMLTKLKSNFQPTTQRSGGSSKLPN